eukprot:IDg21883t1
MNADSISRCSAWRSLAAAKARAAQMASFDATRHDMSLGSYTFIGSIFVPLGTFDLCTHLMAFLGRTLRARSGMLRSIATLQWIQVLL